MFVIDFGIVRCQDKKLEDLNTNLIQVVINSKVLYSLAAQRVLAS